jgi:demethylmenaquinone methyltransferase/2-methoxy-6-polyprenyl-1,4-benzoquinol methylase
MDRVTLPEGDEKVEAVRAMFDAIAPRYDLLNRLLTFRLDVRWRRRAVEALRLGPGAVVLDVGAGTGDLCRDLATRGYQPIGIDLSLGMLHHAPTTVPLVQGDALRLPFADAAAEGAVSGFTLRNVADLGTLFAELRRVLQPGARVALLDVAQPRNRVLRLGHSLYFDHVVPRVGGVLSDRDAYRYLPRSVAYLPPPEDMLGALRAAGFGAVTRQLLSGGIAQLITATRAVTTADERV